MVLCALTPLRAYPVGGPLRAHRVVLYAVTSSVILCVLIPWSSTRSPRLWSSARSRRGPLRAHHVCGRMRAHPVDLYAPTPSEVPCALICGPLRTHPVYGPLRAHPVDLYALTPSVVVCELTPWTSTRSPRLWSPARSPRGPLRAHPVCGLLRAHPVILYALIPSCGVRPRPRRALKDSQAYP